jgi:hypothetical protein
MLVKAVDIWEGELSSECLIELEKESMEQAGEKGSEEFGVVHTLTSKRLSTALQTISKALGIFDEEVVVTKKF